MIEAPDSHGMIATSSSYICMVLHHSYAVDGKIGSLLLPENLLSRVFEFGWNCGWLFCTKSSHDALIETSDPHGMVLTSSSYIDKVFDIIHMLWMQGLDLNHAVCTNIVVPSFWIWMKSCVTALHQMKSWCIDSGSRLTWNGHHILYIHTRCLTSFICCVDKKIGRTSIMLLPQNLLSHVFEFGWNPRSFLASNELIIQWLRLQTHMEWSPHPLHTYTRCLSSFKSCGWEDWISIMLLLQSLLSRVFEFGKNTGWKPSSIELIIQWLRLQTHMEWSPHPLHTYTRCLTSFMCYGWDDWIFIMLLIIELVVPCK